jgi:hypothetical protein
MFPKTDELLVDKLKPRVIWNVPTPYQALLGPPVKRFTERLKSIMDGKTVYSYRRMRFTLYFACGIVADDLDQWYNTSVQMINAHLIDWAGVFLGDDSLILFMQNGKIVAKETDFSSYDRSQGKGCFRYVQGIYRHFGFTEEEIAARHDMFHCALKIRYGDKKQFSFKVRLKSPQMPTGQPGTCSDNSLLSASASIHVMSGGSFVDFGFIAKTKIVNYRDCTFLRGFWCVDLFGVYRWNYLPSVAIKVLKTLKVHSDMFPFSFNSSLSALKASFSSIGPCASPILRVFVQRFGDGTVDPRFALRLARVEKSHLNAFELHRFLKNRYGDVDLIYSLERRCEKVELFGDLRHPAWAVLAQDYA